MEPEGGMGVGALVHPHNKRIVYYYIVCLWHTRMAYL